MSLFTSFFRTRPLADLSLIPAPFCVTCFFEIAFFGTAFLGAAFFGVAFFGAVFLAGFFLDVLRIAI